MGSLSFKRRTTHRRLLAVIAGCFGLMAVVGFLTLVLGGCGSGGAGDSGAPRSAFDGMVGKPIPAGTVLVHGNLQASGLAPPFERLSVRLDGGATVSSSPGTADASVLHVDTKGDFATYARRNQPLEVRVLSPEGHAMLLARHPPPPRSGS